jgi:hypothetical protein
MVGGGGMLETYVVVGGLERQRKDVVVEAAMTHWHWIYTHAVIMCVAWVGLQPRK